MGKYSNVPMTRRSQSVGGINLARRPKRNVSIKTYDDTVGLSRTEERELKKALYASLQECKRLARYQLDTDEQQIPQPVPRQTRPIRSRSWPYTPSVSSTATPSTCVSVDESSQDSVKSSVSSVSEQKTRQERKIHAQRKFAQGSLPPTPSTTPVKVKASPIKLLPRRAKTEDFLTFLCLRGSSVLPPHLDFFNFSRGEPSHGEISAPETPPRPEPGSKCERTRESTPESSSVSTNDELYEIGTPSPCSVIANGRNGLSARKAARASASTPETARGIVSLSQGLTKKATRVSTPHRGRKSGSVDKTPSPRKGSPLVRGSPSKRGFAVKSLSPQFSKTPPKKKLSLKQKALLSFMPRKASTKHGSHREASSKQAVLEGSQPQVTYVQRSQRLHEMIEKLWLRSVCVPEQDLSPTLTSDQNMPLLSPQSVCPPSDQTIPLLSPQSVCSTSDQTILLLSPQSVCPPSDQKAPLLSPQSTCPPSDQKIPLLSPQSMCPPSDQKAPLLSPQSTCPPFDQKILLLSPQSTCPPSDQKIPLLSPRPVCPPSDQKIPLLSPQSTCLPSDQKMPLLSPDLGYPASSDLQRVPVRRKHPDSSVVLEHPPCCQSNAVEEVVAGEGEAFFHFLDEQTGLFRFEILASSKHNPCEHTDGGASMSKVISRSEAMICDEDSEIRCNLGEMDDVISQTGGGGADAVQHTGTRTTDQVVPDVTHLGCVVRIVNKEPGSGSVEDDDNILILPRYITSETKQESQVSGLHREVKALFEKHPKPTCVQGQYNCHCMEDQCGHQHQCMEDQCGHQYQRMEDQCGHQYQRMEDQCGHQYQCKADQCSVQPYGMEDPSTFDAIHSYRHALQAAEQDTFEEYLMNLPPECVIGRGHDVCSSDTWTAGALGEGWTSNDAGMTPEQRRSRADSSDDQVWWQPDSAIIPDRNIPTKETGEWLPQTGNVYLRQEDLQLITVSPELRQVKDVSCVGQGMTLEEAYESDVLLPAYVDAFSGDVSPAKYYPNQNLLAPCVTSCHLEDLLWPDVSQRDDGRVASQYCNTVEVEPPTMERGDLLFESFSLGTQLQQGIDSQLSEADRYNPRLQQILHNVQEEQREHVFPEYSGELDTVQNTLSLRNTHTKLNDLSTEHPESLLRQCHNNCCHIDRWSSHLGPSPGEHLLGRNSFYSNNQTQALKLSEGAKPMSTLREMLLYPADTASGRISDCPQQEVDVSYSTLSTSSQLTQPLDECSTCGSQDSSATESPVLSEGKKEMGYRVKRILVKPRQCSSAGDIPILEIRVIEGLSPATTEGKPSQCSSTQHATVSRVIGCTMSSSVPAMTGTHTQMSAESCKGDGRSAATSVSAEEDDDEEGDLGSALASLAAQCEAMRTRKRRASDAKTLSVYDIRRPPQTSRKDREKFLKNEHEKSPVKTIETYHWKEQGHKQFGKQTATLTGVGLRSCGSPTHKRENRNIHKPRGLGGSVQGTKQGKKRKKLSTSSSIAAVQFCSSLSRRHSSTMVKSISDLHCLQQEKGPHAVVGLKVCSSNAASIPQDMPQPRQGPHAVVGLKVCSSNAASIPQDVPHPRQGPVAYGVPHTQSHSYKSPRECRSRNDETMAVCPVRASAEFVPLPSTPFSVQKCVEEAGRMAIKNSLGYAHIVDKVQLSDQNTVYGASRLFPPPPCVMSCGTCESSHNSFKPVDPVSLHRKSSAQSSKSLKERLKRKKELVEQKFRERKMTKPTFLKGKLKVRSHVTKKDGRVDEVIRKKSGRMEEHPRKKRMVRRSSVRLKELTKAMKAKNKRRRVIETEEEEVTITLPRPSRPVGRKRNFAPRPVGGSGVTDMPRFVREEEEFQIYTDDDDDDDDDDDNDDDDDDDDEVSFGKVSSTGSSLLSVMEKKGKSSGRKKKVIGMRTRSSIQKVVSSPAKIVASKRLSAVKKLRKAKGDQMMLSKIIEKRRRLKQEDGKGEATKRGRKPTGSKKLGSPEKQGRSDSALKADLSSLLEVPTFRPSEEEFRDPIQYIESIREQAEPYGMCQIIPPSSWKCESKINEDMRFTAQVQLVHKLYKRWGPNIQFTASANKHLDAIGANLEPSPQIGGVEVDLCKLSRTIMEFGGMQNVVDKKKWVKIADAMKIPKLAQDRGMRLYDVYCKYLLPYDTLSMDEKTCLDQCVMSERQRKEKSGKGEDEEAIVKGKSNPLSTFNRVARNVRSMWFKDEPTPEQVECEYWKLVEGRSNHVAVQCGHVSTSTQGSGFPSKKDSPYARHSWNLNNLSENPKCILRCLGPVSGATIPTLHIGMLFATSCWCTDVHHLPYIQYLHTGADIIWYSIPKQQEGKLKTAMKELVPSLTSQDPHWLKEDTVMVHPSRLTARGVTVARCVQKPKTFVAIFSKSYTATISCGYNVSESVHYATRNWISSGVSVAENNCCVLIQDLSKSVEPELFSMDALLCHLVSDPTSDVQTLKIAVPFFEKVLMRELTLRKQLVETGLKVMKRGGMLDDMPAAPLSRKRSVDQVEDNVCDVSKKHCFFSKVVNESENLTLSLEEGLKHVQKKKNLKHCKLVYRYPEDELKSMLHSAQCRLDISSNSDSTSTTSKKRGMKK